MRHISISVFINIIFAMAFLAISSTFLIFLKLDRQKYEITTEQRYELIADSFLSGLKLENYETHLEKLYEKYNVVQIKDRKRKLFIINYAKEKSFNKSFLGRIRVFKLDENYYIYLQELGYNIMLKDLRPKSYNSAIAVILFILSNLIMLFLYISLRKKFMPLRILHKEIKKFSEGELDLDIKVINRDEIGKIAASFDKAIKNINTLTKSKTLFMRNMMHELKTPITKGMIITETLEDNKNKEILQRAFNRMNSIIKELATIEKITTNTLLLHKEVTSISNIVNKAIEILMPEQKNIKKEIEDFDLKVDIPLFEIVLKNLIDNAIKFGKDNLATIKCKDSLIEISSQGDKLSKPLEEYLEAFYQDEKRKDGFGLGLYIISEILRLHNLQLQYRYEDNKNIFYINLD